jgi:hypothetical protein
MARLKLGGRPAVANPKSRISPSKRDAVDQGGDMVKIRKQQAVGISGNLQNAEDVLGIMFERGLLGDHAGRRYRAGRKFGDMRRYLFGPMFAG